MSRRRASTPQPRAPRGGARRAVPPQTSRFRRARTMTGAFGVTALGALLPGAGYVWSGRRLGMALMLPSVAALGVLIAYVQETDRLIDVAFDPARLRTIAVVVGIVFTIWAFTVVTTWLMTRPSGLGRARSSLGLATVCACCLLVALPVVQGMRYSMTQADLVATVFENNESATAPTDVTEEDPWGGRDRVSVLLLGGDGGVGRTGVRTDSMILLSMDTHTGRSAMFSLPRNMMNAQFPADSPLHDLYPDYYLLVNLEGFKDIVDAVGGVTVNINEPVAIQGNTDAGIPPVGYLQPGPDQHLNGYHALWFSRGRWGSDDYQRMLRQRCMINALIDELDPVTLLRRYQQLATTGKKIVRTDIPRELLPAFVDLGMRVKEHKVKSVAFVSSDKFFSGDPDFPWMQSVVERTLHPRKRSTAAPSESPTPATGTDGTTETEDVADDPGTAVSVADACGYHPVG